MNTNEKTCETTIEPITCANCGCIIENEDDVITLPDGSIVCCHDCARDLDWVLCEECNEWNSTDDVHEVDGRLLCVDCLESLGYVECDECHEWYQASHLTYVNGGWRADWGLCDDCRDSLESDDEIFFCDHCNDWFRSTVSSFSTNDGDRICEDCYNSDYETCAGCGEIFYRDDMHWDDNRGEWYCDDCWDGGDSHQVHDYGYKPRAVFHGLDHWGAPVFGDPLTMGLELEVDKGDDIRSSLEDMFDYYDEDTLYCKHDGSLHSGYEIVTHPHTLKAIREELDIPKLVTFPRRYGFKSHEAGTCGLHIHVGRAQLGDDRTAQEAVITKIVLLLYRHKSALVKFSRRSQERLDQWARMPALNLRRSSYDDSALQGLVSDYYDRRGGRYHALNLQNRGTIEFRLWRGSLMPDTLLATIQLTHNLVRYAMEHTYEEVTLSKWSDLLSYESCPELERYVEERGLSNWQEVTPIPYGKIKSPAFEIGSYVRIAKASSLVFSGMVGAVGEVVAFDVIDGELLLGLNILRATAPNCVALNDLGGRLPSETGYWAEADAVELVDMVSAIPFGARVVSIEKGEFTNGLVGTVIDNINGYGIRFDGFTGGHNLGGLLHGEDRDSGWYCRRSEIIPLSA